jgi:hypothetical protein
MPKRARYTGAGPVVVTWPPGEVYPEKTWSIEPNHWLPEDAPAALRDHLVANHPDFAGVDQSDSQSSSARRSRPTPATATPSRTRPTRARRTDPWLEVKTPGLR